MNLVRNETAAASHPDALVFVGPKSSLIEVPHQDLKRLGALDYPVCYVIYDPEPQVTPWRDSIGQVVKFFNGREMTISAPYQLLGAVTEIVSQVSQSARARLAGMRSGS